MCLYPVMVYRPPGDIQFHSNILYHNIFFFFFKKKGHIGLDFSVCPSVRNRIEVFVKLGNGLCYELEILYIE